jgi:hypothetical protein
VLARLDQSQSDVGLRAEICTLLAIADALACLHTLVCWMSIKEHPIPLAVCECERESQRTHARQIVVARDTCDRCHYCAVMWL